MHKIPLFAIIIFCSFASTGQTAINLTFRSRDANSLQILSPDSILVQNMNENFDSTLYAPVNKITLSVSKITGVNSIPGNATGNFIVGQNYPNPFIHTTKVSIYRDYYGPLNLTLYDNLGRVLVEHHGNYDKGTNSFTISSSGQRILILCVTDNKNRKSLKLISQGNNRDSHTIQSFSEVRGLNQPILKSTKLIGNFTLGDQLNYSTYLKGYYNITIADRPQKDTIYDFLLVKDYSALAPSILQDGNTVAWYDASDLATIVKDAGNLVSLWKDKLKSGRDLNQLKGSAQPSWSYNGILFDGVNDRMNATFNLSQPECIYLVFKIKSVTASKCILDGYINNSGAISIATGGSSDLQISAGSLSSKTNFPINQTGILKLNLNNAISRMQVNEFISIAGNFGTANMGGLTVGSSGSGINFSNIEVKDIVVRKITDSLKDEYSIYNYLMQKNNLQAEILQYETLSSLLAVREPYKTKIEDVTFTKASQLPVNCGLSSTFVAKKIEKSYAIENGDSTITQTLSNPKLMRFVEDNINCEVFCISDNYIYYGHPNAIFRINKNTFGNKVKFLVSGLWGNGTNVKTSAIEGVNEMPDKGLLIQIDNNPPYSPFYKVPFKDQTTGTYTYTVSDANLVMKIPSRHAILNKAWGLDIKGNYVLAVVYEAIGQAYLSKDAGNSFKCVFSMADTSINSSVTPDKMIYVDTKPNGLGGFGALGGHPMKSTLTNPQEYDLWGPTLNGNLHSHGGCIDKYADRIFIVTGDGSPAVGIFYSDDWGYNWTLIKTSKMLPSTEYTTQFVTAIPMKDCILFGCDGIGDGYWRLFRKGASLSSNIECCYQFTGANTSLVSISGGYCFTKEGMVLGLINPEGDDDYTNIRGGIVATKNGHNFKKLYEDSFSQLSRKTAEFEWRGLISINDNNQVLVKAANGGLIILDFKN